MGAEWEVWVSSFCFIASIPLTTYSNKCLVYILNSLTPSKLFTTDWAFLCKLELTLNYILTCKGIFPSKLELEKYPNTKNTQFFGLFHCLQSTVWFSSECKLQADYPAKTVESLLRNLARIACFKPYLPWCLRAALSHSPAVELQAKPQLEGWVTEGRCPVCSWHCSASSSFEQGLRGWGGQPAEPH